MKISLIGNGYWGSKIKKYIPDFFELRYVADSKFDRNVIWNDKSISSVIVATPMETHYSIIKEALLHGKHVFSEKPITLYEDESEKLKQIASDNGLQIGVDYTHTFARSLHRILELIDIIGNLEFVEMNTKHLGRFMDFDVYWLLASHYLSVLDMFMDIDLIDFKFEDHLYYNNLCTDGSIIFDKGRINVSTNFPGKEMSIVFYGDKGTIKYSPLSEKSIRITLYEKLYKKLPPELTTKDIYEHFDESNNLKYAIKYFKDLLEGKVDSNIDRAIKITRILENR